MNRAAVQKISLVLGCLVPFFGFWSYGLFDLDEGFYGAVVRDMLRRHDWITPTLNGHPWFEKPILSYWLAMPSVALFGNEFGARLPSVLSTLATAYLWYRFCNTRGLKASAVVPVAYCGSVLVLGIGRMMMTDAPLVLCLTVAVISLCDVIDGRSISAWIVGVATGLGLLAKGPIALALIGLTGIVLLVRLKGQRKQLFLAGIIILVTALFVASLWYIPCYLANRSLFVDKFLIEQNIGRFSGGDRAHAVPVFVAPFYFPVVLLVALLPWTLWAKRDGWRTFFGRFVRWESVGWREVLMAYSVVVFVLFTISGSKLPHYILPAVGPLLMLFIDAIQHSKGSFKPGLKEALVWNGALAGIAIATFTAIDSDQFRDIRNLAWIANSSTEPLVSVTQTGVEAKGVLGSNTTSNPSLGFYMNRPIQDVDNLDSLTRQNYVGLMIVHKGIITEEVIRSATRLGHAITAVNTDGNRFELWHMAPALAH